MSNISSSFPSFGAAQRTNHAGAVKRGESRPPYHPRRWPEATCYEQARVVECILASVPPQADTYRKVQEALDWPGYERVVLTVPGVPFRRPFRVIYTANRQKPPSPDELMSRFNSRLHKALGLPTYPKRSR